MLRHKNPLTIAAISVMLAGCGDDVRVTDNAAAPAPSTDAVGDTAQLVPTGSLTSPVVGSLVLRIGLSIDANVPVDIHGRACLAASGVLTNTLTAVDFHHLAGSAQTAHGHVFDIAASIRIADGFLTGTFYGSDALFSGYLDGHVDADPLLRRWRSNSGCQGSWAVSRPRTAATASDPISDVARASAWRIEATPTRSYAEDGGACGKLHGEARIIDGNLVGALQDLWGQTTELSGIVMADGHVTAGEVAIVFGDAASLQGRFNAATATGLIESAGACDYRWQGARAFDTE